MIDIDETHPAAKKFLFDVLRRAGCGHRAAMARSLSQTAIDLSRRELAARMPGASPDEVRLRWVELNYGADLAARLRAFLAARLARALAEAAP